MPTYKFISQILIAFGILLINLFVFTLIAGYVCNTYYNVDVAQVLKNSNFDIINHNQTIAIRIFQGIVSLGSFTFSAFVISFLLKQKPIEYLKLNKKPEWKVLLFIPILLFVSVPFISWLLEINSKLTFPGFISSVEVFFKNLEQNNNKIYDLMLTMNTPTDLYMNIVIMALIPAIGEELFCRGVLLNIFYGYTQKFYRSAFMVALVFSMLHLQLYKIVPMVLIAFLLGVFVSWTKGLWASIIFHFLNNSMAVVGKYLFIKGYDNFFTNQQTVFPYYYVIISFVLSFAVVYFLNKNYKNE
ncbi:MAG: CPBP family intramembrane metalloprotease [Bacteroidetes bacterium]|nr:CPBP family intramembrane metalloprotease [Bacteroidota bacterium]